MYTNRSCGGRTQGSPGQGPKGLKNKYYYKRNKSFRSDPKNRNSKNTNNTNEFSERDDRISTQRSANISDHQNDSNQSITPDPKNRNSKNTNNTNEFSNKEAPSKDRKI